MLHRYPTYLRLKEVLETFESFRIVCLEVTRILSGENEGVAEEMRRAEAGLEEAHKHKIDCLDVQSQKLTHIFEMCCGHGLLGMLIFFLSLIFYRFDDDLVYRNFTCVSISNLTSRLRRYKSFSR